MDNSGITTLCPFCREEIAPGAIICKHCGSPLKKPKKTAQKSFWVNNFMLGVYTGIVFMILMIILYHRIF